MLRRCFPNPFEINWQRNLAGKKLVSIILRTNSLFCGNKKYICKKKKNKNKNKTKNVRELLEKILDRLPTVPALAEEQVRLEQSVLHRLFSRRVVFSGSNVRVPYAAYWWGWQIDVSSADIDRAFAASNWINAFGTILGGQIAIAGEPNSAVLSVVCKFLAVYGTALRFLDRGQGVRFIVPYTAVFPVFNPLMILPLPIAALEDEPPRLESDDEPRLKPVSALAENDGGDGNDE